MSSMLRRAVCAALVLALLMTGMVMFVPANSQAASDPVFQTRFDEASGWTSLAAVPGWHVNAGTTSGPYMLDSGVLNAQLDGGGSCASHSLDLSGEYNVSFTLSIDGFFGSPAVAGAIGLYSGSANERLYETTPDPASYRTARLYSDSVTNSFGFYSNQEGTTTHAAPAWSMTTYQQYTVVLCRFHDGSGWHERNNVLNNQGTVVSYQERDLGTSAPVAITQFIICSDNDGISGTNYLLMMVDSLTVYDVAFPAGQTPVWAPSFTTTPPATVSVNGQYDYVPQLNETGTIELISGPGWASMDDGHVLGTPTEAGDYDFSLRGTSTAGTLSAWENWTVTVQNTPTYAITSTPVTTGTQGLAYTYAPICNGTVTEWALSGNATFLTIDTATGRISGTPMTAGSYTVTITANTTPECNQTYNLTVSALDWNVTIIIRTTASSLKVTTSYTLSNTSLAGAVESVSWNFGDGSANQSGATAIHTYAAAGTYTVTCTVTSVADNTTVATKSVTVKAASSPTTVTSGGGGGGGSGSGDSTSSGKNYSLIYVGALIVAALVVVVALTGGKRKRGGRRRGW